MTSVSEIGSAVRIIMKQLASKLRDAADGFPEVGLRSVAHSVAADLERYAVQFDRLDDERSSTALKAWTDGAQEVFAQAARP